MHILSGISHLFFHILHTYGLLALFALLVIEEAGVPLPAPGDTLIALMGAQPHRTLGFTVATLALCTLAVFIGSSALYWVMRRGGRPLLDKYGRFLRLNPQRLTRMESWLSERGTVAIVLGRLIPGLRVPTTVMCGLSGVPYRVYAPSAALAGLVWAALYFFLGALLGRHLSHLASFATGLLDTIGDSTTLTIILLVLLVALGLGAWGGYRRWRASHTRAHDGAAEASRPVPPSARRLHQPVAAGAAGGTVLGALRFTSRPSAPAPSGAPGRHTTERAAADMTMGGAHERAPGSAVAAKAPQAATRPTTPVAAKGAPAVSGPRARRRATQHAQRGGQARPSAQGRHTQR